MGDWLVVLLVILAVVFVWRGPKTLPKIGQALGRSVKEVRKELETGDPAATPETPITPESPEKPDRT
jgi:sec-independent protein translocase protein TatA